MPNVNVIICARGGSTRVKRKNVRLLGGKPLIAHSIEFAKKLKFVDKIYINSDDDEIVHIGKQYDCNVYKRPVKMGLGNIFVIDVIKEMITKKGLGDEKFLVMFPTVPLRQVSDFTLAYDKFKALNYEKQVVSISGAPYPYQVALKLENHTVSPIFPEFYKNSTRHTDYETSYHANYSFVFSSGLTLLKNQTLIEDGATAILTHPMSSIDIDDEFQFFIAEAIYEKQNK